MIRELRIRNLALIESLTFEFGRGFTVFTGETGAGKSILIGAIGLLLGERASAESIRSGCNEAEVGGIFEVDLSAEPFRSLLEKLSITADDNQLIIRRRLSAGDRSRIHVNETPLSLAALRRIGDLLIDLHGQHEHQSLLNEQTHHEVIDRLEGVKPLRRIYDAAWRSFAEARRALDRHDADTRLLNEKREMLEFQLHELDQAHLKSGEEEELEAELKLLSSSAQRMTAVSGILELIGSSTAASLDKQVASVRRHLEQLARYDPSARPWIDDVENAQRIFSELEAFCSSYLSTNGERADPTRIEKINARLARIQRLKKKYSATIEGLIDKEQSLRGDLASLDNSGIERRELEKTFTDAQTACVLAGKKLGEARQAAVRTFDRTITVMMERLGFKGGGWRTRFAPLDAPSEQGCETLRFFVRTNPGEAELPLAATASGGEISRLMLAVKTVLSRSDYVPVLIFDEIDSGIGGIVAGAVGDALRELSLTHQVLCISHLHQIASLADRQVKVYKKQSGGRTVTCVEELSNEQRVNEIARMLGGDSKIALEHARELLGKGKKG
ncbi:MAG: DNA repair protein RecN [Chitinispirillaceae bacterium]|nr:DNA repair protein RecN [Chitinispirillaceae bacterium]